jgi:hypothetical protein
LTNVALQYIIMALHKGNTMEHLNFITDVEFIGYSDEALVTECIVMSAQTNDWS